MSSISASQADSKAQARILDGYGKLPLSFEANQGQTDPQVRFLSRGAGYSLFLTSTEAVLALTEGPQQKPAARAARAPGSAGAEGPALHAARASISHDNKTAVLRMKLVGANAKAEVIGQDELPGKSNYFIGNDPKKWHTNVRQFAKVRYEGVYPGIDLVYYGNQRKLEYDFVLQPGANPQAIRLGIEGARRLRLEQGDLVLTNDVGDVHLRSPHIYQEANGVRQEVRGRYVITSRNEVGFRVAAYDRRRALVIDPVLAYSTYLGGSGSEGGGGLSGGIAVDSAGNAYVTGRTSSTDFPTVNPIQSTNHGAVDAFVTKFNADGSALVYSTYLGGSGDDIGTAITVDSTGNAYVTGITSSTDFPTTPGAFQPTCAGSCGSAFVTEINSSGSALVYSSYLGGSGGANAAGIAVDGSGNAYVAGYAFEDFPTTPGAFQRTYGGNGDAFASEVNPTGTALVYSTYLGGSNTDFGDGIAVDSSGNAYVTGLTESTDFPTASAIQPTFNGGNMDAFVTKLNADGSALIYSTYLGGSGDDVGFGVAVDAAGNAYIAGRTYSTDFPTANAFQPTNHGAPDAFVTKINAAGSAFVYSTYLGGSSYDEAYRIAIDGSGNAYITGDTYSSDFPLASAVQSAKSGLDAPFVTKLDAAGNGLVYSTYLGGKRTKKIIIEQGYGIAADAAGSAYVTGFAISKKFPITPLAFQLSLKGPADVFVAKIAQQTFVSVAPAKLGFATQTVDTTSKAKNVTVTNQGQDSDDQPDLYWRLGPWRLC